MEPMRVLRSTSSGERLKAASRAQTDSARRPRQPRKRERGKAPLQVSRKGHKKRGRGERFCMSW